MTSAIAVQCEFAYIHKVRKKSQAPSWLDTSAGKSMGGWVRIPFKPEIFSVFPAYISALVSNLLILSSAFSIYEFHIFHFLN